MPWPTNPGLHRWMSFGNGLGYGLILVIVAFFRELLGSGKIYGFRVIPQAVYDSGYMADGCDDSASDGIDYHRRHYWVQPADP